jgi:hypothetical protein
MALKQGGYSARKVQHDAELPAGKKEEEPAISYE